MSEPDVEIAFREGLTCVSQLSSVNPGPSSCSKVLIQVIIPDHHWKFVYKVPTNTLVRELLRRVFASCHLDAFEYANYGLYIPPTDTQKGKFLQEERLLTEYPQLLTSPADDLDDLHSPPFIDEEDEEQLDRLEKAASLRVSHGCRQFWLSDMYCGCVSRPIRIFFSCSPLWLTHGACTRDQGFSLKLKNISRLE
ncbi:unnamed protein product [Echinostoma caproni]|uniref:UBX domain-containing protein n=1 Tax=Echinostoma caproni TaxID=27848 RepID=A0A183BEC0_9TREM|nr:unnamed protein product [Echinostoma caproni]